MKKAPNAVADAAESAKDALPSVPVSMLLAPCPALASPKVHIAEDCCAASDEFASDRRR